MGKAPSDDILRGISYRICSRQITRLGWIGNCDRFEENKWFATYTFSFLQGACAEEVLKALFQDWMIKITKELVNLSEDKGFLKMFLH